MKQIYFALYPAPDSTVRLAAADINADSCCSYRRSYLSHGTVPVVQNICMFRQRLEQELARTKQESRERIADVELNNSQNAGVRYRTVLVLFFSLVARKKCREFFLTVFEVVLQASKNTKMSKFDVSISVSTSVPGTVRITVVLSPY